MNIKLYYNFFFSPFILVHSGSVLVLALVLFDMSCTYFCTNLIKKNVGNMQNTINKADLRVNQQESIHVINVVGSGMPYLCYSIISMLNYYKQSETRQ